MKINGQLLSMILKLAFYGHYNVPALEELACAVLFHLEANPHAPLTMIQPINVWYRPSYDFGGAKTAWGWLAPESFNRQMVPLPVRTWRPAISGWTESEGDSEEDVFHIGGFRFDRITVGINFPRIESHRSQRNATTVFLSDWLLFYLASRTSTYILWETRSM